MSKLTTSLEEIISLCKGELPPDFREKLATAMVDFANSPEVRAKIEERAEEIATARVGRAIRDAFVEINVGYGKPKDLGGWGGELLKRHIKDNITGKTLSDIVSDVVIRESKHVQEQYHELKGTVSALVEREVTKVMQEKTVEKVLQEADLEKVVTTVVTKVLARGIGVRNA